MKNLMKFFAVLIISSLVFSSSVMATDKPAKKATKACCSKEHAAKCAEAKKECSEASKTETKEAKEKCETLKKECSTEKKEAKATVKEVKPEKK